MTTEKPKARVLIASGSDKGGAYFKGLLPESRFEAAGVVNRADETRRRLGDREVDILIINAPLADDFGLRLAADVAANSDTGVLLVVKNELYEQVSFQTEEYGVLTLGKPLASQSVLQALGLLAATRSKLRALERKTATLESKMEEIRLVARAKLLLIEQMQMSEAEAHRYIERHAMDACVKRKEIAFNIIEKYDTKGERP